MGIQEVELERAGEKSAVDSSDPVWRHGASILGTTRTDTRARILTYWALCHDVELLRLQV